MTTLECGHLTLPYTDYYGVPSLQSVSMSLQNSGIAHIIMIPKTGTLTKVYVVASTCNTPQQVNVRICTIDANGLPTDTLIDANATGTIASPVTNAAYWVPINGGTGISVTAGTYVAIKYNLNVAGSVSLRTGSTGFDDIASFPYCASTSDNVTWTKISSTNKVNTAIQYATYGIVPIAGAYPCTGISLKSVASNTNPDRVGNKFIMNFTCRVTGISYFINNLGAGSIVIYDADGVTEMASIPLTTTYRRTNVLTNLFIPLATPLTFKKGNSYRVVWRAENTTSSTVYAPDLSADDGVEQMIEAWPSGTSVIFTSCNGTPVSLGSWTDNNLQRGPVLFIFDAIEVGVSSCGTGGGFQ